MLSVRERPPLRLSVNITTPGGAEARWGADDPNPANQPQGLTFSTTMPGGYESFNLTLQRDPRRAWADLEELSRITVQGPGGQTAWQGRLEALPDTGGSQSQISPSGSGYQNALQDDQGAAMVYLDQNLSNWQGPSLARQISLAGSNYSIGSNGVASDPADNAPSIVLQIDGAWASPSQPIAESWYDSGIAGPLAKLYYSLDNPSGFQSAVFLSQDDKATTVESSASIASGTSGLFAPATPYRYALVQTRPNVTPGGASGAQYVAYWTVAVVGNHGLPIQGTWPGTIGLLASDVIGHAINTWASEITYTTGTNGTIQASSFAIPQLAFTTATTAAAIIQQAAQYELLDWAVWEGPTFWLNPLGKSARTRNWRCRIGDCQLQEAGPDITRLFNGVIVSFSNADGTPGTVGPPGSGAQTTSSSLKDSDPQNPANQAGITKYGLLQMGTTTPAAATQVGMIYLQAQSQLNLAGQASLVGHVQDDRGVWWPAWMVRAGDTLSVVDAADSSPRRITATSYSDASKTNQVTLGSPPDTTTALLERLSTVIAPYGLS